MKKHLVILTLLATGFTACDTSVKVKPVVAGTSSTNIKNDIDVNASGLKLSQAYLTYEDGSLVPEGNPANVNQKVILRLVIDGGWKETDKKVFIGASEQVVTNTGEVVLNVPDLFESYSSGVNAEDARFVRISAVITRMEQLYDHFIVNFRVWDKQGNGEIKGSYKIKIAA